jgi:hypothetical protein
MMWRPLHPPERPDVTSGDEAPCDISNDDPAPIGESEEEKAARIKKNKNKQARRNRAQHRREAIQHSQADYRNYEEELERRQLADLVEQNHIAQARGQSNANRDRERRLESVSRNLEPDFMEVAGHKVYNTPYTNVVAMANELANKPNLTPDEEHLKIMLQSTALQLNGRNLASVANPAQPEPRKSAHERIGSQTIQQGSDRNNRPLGDLRHHINHREGWADSAYRMAGISNGSPYFSERLRAISFPPKIKPSNYTKYDGKTEPWQWLHDYSIAVDLAGGD